MKKTKLFFLFFLPFLFSFFLISCGNYNIFKKKEEKPAKVEKLFNKANKLFAKGYYESAYNIYEKIRNYYPGSPQALYALLRMADCKFWNGEYLEAVSLYKEFEKFYPANEAIPYVIFQIGNCYYNLKRSYDRDQTYTKKALEAYKRLLENFPNSPYTDEVKKRIKILRELLAKHELYIAQFYYKIKYYKAAYGRLAYLLNNYPDTESAKQAKLLIKKYKEMALKEDAELKAGTKKDFWGNPVQ